MGLESQAIMVSWLVYELSHDPLLLGLIGLAEAIPAIGFSFWAGHVVDNRKPAWVYRLATLTLIFNSLLIWITAVAPMPLNTRLVLLFVGVFISGMVRSFTGPATFALISHIVPRAQMAEASAFNSGAFQLASVIGPAAGGIIYGELGAPIAFAFPIVFLLITAFMQMRFSTSTREMRSEAKREPFVESVRGGIRYVFEHKALLAPMVLDMFSVLFGGAVAVLPIFSDEILHAGSKGLGFLRAAPSVGAALIAIILVYRPLRTISGKVLLVVVTGFGLATIAFGLSRSFALAFFFLALSGLFDGISMVIRNTILQLLTPNHMRGRISSLSSIFITSSNEIGAFESGVAARYLGLIPSIVVGGSLTLLVVGVTAWLSPELRHTSIRPEDEPLKGATA